MTCDELRSQAAGLASLPEHDPERREAFAHARGCAGCAAALAEGGALMDLLDEALPMEAPRAEALARASAEIIAELGGVAAARTRRPFAQATAVLAATAASWLLPMAAGRRFGAGAAALPSIAIGVLALVSTGAALTLGGPWFAAVPLISFLVSALGGGDGALQAGGGLHCLVFEVTFSLPPLAVATLLAWRGKVAAPRRALMTAAAGGALAAQGVLHLACQAFPSHGHLFAFHTGGVLVAAALGAITARLLPRAARA